jgi:phosphoglycolate phosphatase
MYKFALFDLDGTLTDSKPGIVACVEYALRDFGITVEDTYTLTPFVGPPLRDSFRDFYSFSDADAERAVAKYRERYHTVGWKENSVYPGVEDMLQTLRDAGVRLAIATSKPQKYARLIAENFGLAFYFDCIIGSEFDGTRGKKSEVVAETLCRLGVTDTCEAIMIGDRKFDVLGAAENRLCTVGVRYGYADAGELEKAGAIFVADTPGDAARFILGGEK